MMSIYRDIVLEALTELADGSYQERVWAGEDPAEISSFSECIERLFGDSGLSIALERGRVFGSPADEQLRSLSQLVDSVDANQREDWLLQDPALLKCRHLAEEILRGLPAVEDRGSS